MKDNEIIILFSSILFLNILVKILKNIIKEKRPNNKKYGMPSSKATVTTFIFIYLIKMYKFKEKTLVILLIIMCFTLFIKHLYKEHSFYQLLIGCIIGYIFANMIIFISKYFSYI
tara:strand:- start:960 stop:1304 length:345 start_codon:yes stop_codon:yes gene_type:complete